MPDDELTKLLDQLDSHVDDKDETVERARESLESTLRASS